MNYVYPLNCCTDQSVTAYPGKPNLRNAGNPILGRSLPVTSLASSTPTSSITDSDQFHSTDLESDDSEVTFKGFRPAQTKAQKKAARKKKSEVPLDKSLK